MAKASDGNSLARNSLAFALISFDGIDLYGQMG